MTLQHSQSALPASLDRFSREDRITPIAVLSAGFMGPNGAPQRSGKIHVNGQPNYDEAPAGLLAALTAGGFSSLRIMLPHDDLGMVFRQGLSKWSKTRLEAFGDSEGITEFKPTGMRGNYVATAERVYHPAGTPEYDRLRAECTVSSYLYFWLCEYVDGVPCADWTDGVRYYALRTSGFHTSSNLRQMLQAVSQLTRGHLAGIPLNLKLSEKTKINPIGNKVKVPVFEVDLALPEGKRMLMPVVSQVVKSSIQQLQEFGAQLEAMSLPAPSALPALPEIDEADFEEVSGALEGFNPETYRRDFFALTGLTPYAEDENRHKLIANATAGKYSGLRELLAGNDPEARGAVMQYAERLVDNYLQKNPEKPLKPTALKHLKEAITQHDFEATDAGVVFAMRRLNPDFNLSDLPTITVGQAQALLKMLGSPAPALPTPDTAEDWLA